MTITLQAVNELIASLESAGELSIKETKVMALAKAYHQLAADRDAVVAENAALKSAIDHTIEWIESTNGDPCDVVIIKGIETPATDRIVAGIKADAITASLDACSDYLETDCVMDRLDISYEEAETRTSGAIEFHDAMVDFANQVREGADK
ncbi:hypothetical protein QTN19_20455 [Klebsiella pneumoniae]|uniref:hypothetical protein n=1 Tax=Klebsiella pneumoniae TaxID=573 RepID=UPI00257004C6|nr:hypothetical protein [Klebsiella pneumoniae]MDL5527852.1 hypothetical protein [Klebsiella pneumoniae]MDL5535491.1 hypothetical protein [Klebsiella pneumoniae]WJM18886.1 hypothetical protein QTN20_21410 [Klebsiella pneumoniae]WKA16368.1 hypothetical protein QTN19_20455 [Klebsiella pneumoniae]